MTAIKKHMIADMYAAASTLALFSASVVIFTSLLVMVPRTRCILSSSWYIRSENDNALAFKSIREIAITSIIPVTTMGHTFILSPYLFAKPSANGSDIVFNDKNATAIPDALSFAGTIDI